MLEIKSENMMTRVISVGLVITTILVFAGPVTDPVNAPKFLALGGTAVGAFVLLVHSVKKKFKILFNPLNISVMAFLLFGFLVTIESHAPLSQSLYGDYGRNTGYLAYAFLGLLAICASLVNSVLNFDRILKALVVAGVINLAYCLWVISFGDFIGWSNPYGAILGTLGNPNFISAFLGILSTFSFSIIAAPKFEKKYKLLALVCLPLILFEILKSNSFQGKVLFVLGVTLVSFYFIKSRYNKIYALIYVLFVIPIGIVATLGVFRLGPLSKIMYQETISLRQQYWYAAWKTAVTNPFFGVGFDSFGDWYRRSRGLEALTHPGVETVTNAAHNVLLDILASGGFPLLLLHLSSLIIIFVSVIRFTVRMKEYDFRFVSLVSVWVCYEVQSLISINQLGLAIWGWVFGGLIYAYERFNRNGMVYGDNTKDRSFKGRVGKGQLKQTEVLTPGVVAAIAILLGILLSCPPLSADMKWREAQDSKQLARLEDSMTPSFLNPMNTYKAINIANELESNKLYDLSYKYTKYAVEFNPDSFDAWRLLYFLTNSTSNDRDLALKNMKRLDPLNPNIKVK